MEKIEGTKIKCPLCGKKIELTGFRCESCAKFFNEGELNKAEDGTENCPDCGSVIEHITGRDDEINCPECDFVFQVWEGEIKEPDLKAPSETKEAESEDEDEFCYECPCCGGLMDLGATTCPGCGSKFMDFGSIDGELQEVYIEEEEILTDQEPMEPKISGGEEGECPVCRAALGMEDKICSACGADLTDFKKYQEKALRRSSR
jgi:predicted amidophosphoribosyltransferase